MSLTARKHRCDTSKLRETPKASMLRHVTNQTKKEYNKTYYDWRTGSSGATAWIGQSTKGYVKAWPG